MTTPTLPELRANTALTPMLQCAPRIDQELADLGTAQSEQPLYMRLMQKKIVRMRAIEGVIQQLRSSRAEAYHLTFQLLSELQQATAPIERRTLMSTEEAVGT